MIEFIAFTLFIILFFMLVFKNVQLKIKLSSATVELLKAYIDKTILSEKLSEISIENDKKSDPSSEAFLKFISDSRDWAYQYIDEVQEGLNKFITDIEPEIVYFDEYGVVGSAYPHYYSMKKISGAYKELKKMLPEDYDRIE
jgi:alpha-L-fucosidase